jgi:cytochrome c-type biogenesis protein CcmH
MPWVAVALVVVVALVIGTVGQNPPTDDQRAQNLAESIRCPSCKSQSAASSDTPSSLAVRALIAERIEAGDTDEEIRDFVASRYGREVLLDPSSSGFGALVWALPVVLVVVAVAGLVVRFRGYRAGGTRHASAADEALVAQALIDAEASTVARSPGPTEQR